MKNKFYLIFAFISIFIGHAQTGIGLYSVHDGGFENQATGNVSATTGGNTLLTTTTWSTSTTSSAAVSRAILATGGRTGPQCASFGSLSTSQKYFYSPVIPGGSFAPNTKYQIQFFYKPSTTTAVLASSSVNLVVDNSTFSAPIGSIGTIATVPAGLSASASGWTRVAVEVTSASTVGTNGVVYISFTTAAASTNFTASFDDFVIYQANSPDTTAPSSPGAITATGTTSGGANVSWGAASGGVDGGGYVVVRYATSAPSASDDVVQNGIYKFANTVGAGVVRYIGSGTSFTDSGLSPGVDYYYKVYTVDKAFNYSDESVTSIPAQSIATTYYYKGTGLLTDVANWGLNTNGSGTAPSNFTDASQVFEIRNTTAVTLDGVWTVGLDPANGTKIRLGSNSQPAITLTINSGASIGPAGTGNLDVTAPSSGGQKVIYKGTTAISFGNIFDSNLEVVYDGVAVSSSSTKSFGTISIINGASVTLSATPIIKNLNVDDTSTLVAPTSASSAFITIPSGGSVSINGTVKVPKLTGFVSSNVGTSNDTFAAIQFIAAENLTLGANSIVEYVRTANGAQTVTARTDYKNLILSGSTPKNINGPTTVSGTFTVNQANTTSAVTLTGDVTINGTVSFVLGKITTGVNTLTIGTSGTITGADQASGWVDGNLKKLSASNTNPSYIYAIGDVINYLPLELTFSGNTSVSGGLTAKINIADHPQIATSGLDGTKSVNKSWSLTNEALASFGAYSAAFSYTTADIDAGSTPANYKIRLYNGLTWSASSVSGTPTDTAATAIGITAFGDFAIGENDPLSVKDNISKKYTLYPNPVYNGVLYISSDNSSERSVEIYDLIGKKVFSANSISDMLQINSLKTGIYLAKVKTDKATSVQKIVIKNN